MHSSESLVYNRFYIVYDYNHYNIVYDITNVQYILGLNFLLSITEVMHNNKIVNLNSMLLIYLHYAF